jgi:hemoglobin/transferrin/lactoferrin receptor protein
MTSKKTINAITRAAALSSVATLALAGSAMAQTTATDAAAVIDQQRTTLLERLVIGAGIEKVAIDTPQAVSVITQDELDRTQPTTVGDIFDGVPSVSTSGSERVLGQSFNIRGIGAPETAGDEGRIIVNIDGVPKFFEQYRMGGFFTDPELFKRVEVLRGPASSTLYGSGALGGVINFTTKDASDFIADGDTGALRLKSSYGSNGDSALASAIFAQRFGDDFEVLASGNYRTSDNFKTGNGFTVPGTEFDAFSGLVKGTYTFGDNREQTLSGSYMQWQSDGDNQFYDQITGSPDFGLVDRKVTDKTGIIAYANPAADNPFLDLDVRLSYSDTRNRESGSTSPRVGAADYGYETYQFSASNTFDYLGDAFESYLTVGTQSAYQERSRIGASPSRTHPEGTDVQTGVFVQNETIFNDRLTVITGARLDYQELQPGDSTGFSASESDTAFSPKIAAIYNLTDNLNVFGSYAYTERFPTLDESFDGNMSASTRLNKERSNNIEFGFALSAYNIITGGDALQFKTTVFHNDVRDLIESNIARFGPAGPVFANPRYTNTGRTLIQGGELELAYESEYIFASAAYSRVRGENKLTGGFLNTVAPDELSLTLGGRLPERNLEFGWKSRIVAAQDETVTRPRTAAFDLHDVFVTWKPDAPEFHGLEASFGIDNIFDEQHTEFLSTEPGKGRTFKVSLVKQFGW